MHPSCWRNRHRLVRPSLQIFSHAVFSDVSSHPIVITPLHQGLLCSRLWISLLIMYAFPWTISHRMIELTVISDCSVARQSPSGSFVGRLRIPRPATAAREWYSQ